MQNGRLFRPMIRAWLMLAAVASGLAAMSAIAQSLPHSRDPVEEQEDPRATARLLEILQDEREVAKLRFSAFVALARLRDPRVTDYLVTTRLDIVGDCRTRMDFVRALGSTKNVGMLSWLMNFAINGREASEVSKAAEEAIQRLVSEPQAVPALLALAKNPAFRDDIQVYAMLVAVKVTKGAIADVDALWILKQEHPSFVDEDCSDGFARSKNEALGQVAQCGTTRAVRWTAAWYLYQREHRLSAGTPPFMVLCVIYYGVGLLVWTWRYRESLKRRQFSLRALFVLSVIIAVGLPLLQAALGF